MWEAISGIFSWFGGEGIGASIARIAIGLGISKLLNKTNESAAQSSSSSTVQGTRQQISPATDNKIPVAYGDSYFSGTVTDFQLTNNSKEMYAVIDLCEKTGDLFSTNPSVPSSRTMSAITIDEVYLNNQRVTFKADGITIDYTTDDTGVVDTNAQGLAAVCLYSGSSNAPLGSAPVAYELMPGWDNTYTNQNKVFAVIKCNYDPSKGLHTIPTFKFHVRNTLVQPGDVILDYMTNEMYGCGIPESQIDLASILWLNSFSLQDVTLGSYPAQPRYRINGLVRTTENVMTNLQKLAAACGSFVSYDISLGKWAIVVNKSTAKTYDFNDSNILGQIAITSSNLDQFYNKVEVQFPYKVLKDQYNYVRFDLPEIYRNANEMDNQLQITHEFVNDPVQATILANLDLRQSRENQTITFKTDYSMYGIAIGSVFGVTNSENGWTNKLFRAIRIKRAESDSGQLTVEITGQTYNEDVYTVEDISDFIPLVGVGHSVPSLTPIQTPIAPTVTSQTLSSQPSITITGTVPAGLVTLMEFWAHNNATDSTGVYHSLGTLRPENGGVFTTGDVSSFKTVLLSSGTWLFRVSAANPSAGSESQLSPASAPLAYTYVQAPDVLPYSTPVVNGEGDEIGGSDTGSALAAVVGYGLTKLNWFGEGGILGFGDPTSPPFVVGEEYTVVTVGTTNFAAIGGSNFVGNVFTATGVGSGNGTAKMSRSLTSVLGMNGDQAKKITDQVKAEKDAVTAAAGNKGFNKVSATGNVLIPDTNPTLSVVAGPGAHGGKSKIVVKTNADTNTLIIDFESTCPCPGDVNPPVEVPGGNVTISGHVFPNLFGDGPTTGSTSRAGIFTHDHLVFAGRVVSPLMLSSHVIVKPLDVTATVTGKIQNFYTMPGVGSFSQKPFYNETSTDKYSTNTKLTLYYSTATYSSGTLDQQAWSPWKKVGAVDGVTGNAGSPETTTAAYDETVIDPAIPAVYKDVWTNPPPVPTTAPDEAYVIEEIRQIDAVGNTEITGGYVESTYDPFKPNVKKTILVSAAIPESSHVVHHDAATTPAVTESRAKQLQLTATGPTVLGPVVADNLIIFGTSVYNLADNTPFANNTLFGHRGPSKIAVTYPVAKAFRMMAASSAMFVGIENDTDVVWYSETGDSWTEIKLDADVSSEDPDWVNPTDTSDADTQVIPPFKFIVHDGSKFIVYGFGDEIATSTDGKVWTEVHTTAGLNTAITHVIAEGGRYLACSINGVQNSNDGITWSAITMPAGMGSRGPDCGCWDGTAFVVGNRWSANSGSVLWQSTDGSSWNAIGNLNNPGNSQSVSVSNNATFNAAQSYQNDYLVGMLP